MTVVRAHLQRGFLTLYLSLNKENFDIIILDIFCIYLLRKSSTYIRKMTFENKNGSLTWEGRYIISWDLQGVLYILRATHFHGG